MHKIINTGNFDLLAHTQAGLEQLMDHEKLEVRVQNEEMAQALEQLAQNMAITVERKTLGQDFSISFFTQNTTYFPNLEGRGDALDEHQDLIITISRKNLGPVPLGEMLMRELIGSLKALKKLPKLIIFYNQGVELLKTSSPSFKDLVYLKDMGTGLAACELSLNHYKITQPKHTVLYSKLSMVDIVSYLAGNYKIISF